MTNLEKYRSELEPYVFANAEWGVINGKIYLCSVLKCRGCLLYCDDCKSESCVLKRLEWLQKEYSETKEQDIDWTKVAVDTPILVSDNEEADEKEWYRRYFSHFEKGKVFAFNDGLTGWSSDNCSSWKYAKLADVNKD